MATELERAWSGVHSWGISLANQRLLAGHFVVRHNTAASVYTITSHEPDADDNRAIADYYLRPKLAYHAIKQSLAPLVLGIKREIHKHPRDEYTQAYIDQETRVYVWASSFLLHSTNGALVIKAFDVITGEEIYRKDHGIFEMEKNCTTELVDFKLPTTEKIGDDTDRVVLAAYLMGTESELLARYISWPDVLK